MNNKEIVEKLLKENPRGLTIQNLADKTKLGRQKIAMILAEIKGQGTITIREEGKSKIHYWEGEK